jgi:hypothetical protein
MNNLIKTFPDDTKRRNEGSAWAYLLKGACCLVLFFFLPWLALQPDYEKIDRWSNSMEGNIITLVVTLLVLGVFVVFRSLNWWKNNSW